MGASRNHQLHRPAADLLTETQIAEHLGRLQASHAIALISHAASYPLVAEPNPLSPRAYTEVRHVRRVRERRDVAAGRCVKPCADGQDQTDLARSFAVKAASECPDLHVDRHCAQWRPHSR